MLDDPDKTTKLPAALKAAVPIEVELTEWLASRRKRLGIEAVYKKLNAVDEAEAARRHLCG
jgi:hypothetical protein